jgi:hypothetical protein
MWAKWLRFQPSPSLTPVQPATFHAARRGCRRLSDGLACSVDGCPHPPARAGYCGGHTKRRTRRRPLHTPLRPRHSSREERLTEAALAFAERARRDLRQAAAEYAEAEGDADFQRAWHRLRMAATHYARAKKPRNGWPPKDILGTEPRR